MLKQVQNKCLWLLHHLHASFDLLRGRLDLTGVREVLQLKKTLCTLSENRDNHGAVAVGCSRDAV